MTSIVEVLQGGWAGKHECIEATRHVRGLERTFSLPLAISAASDQRNVLESPISFLRDAVDHVSEHI